MSASIRTLDECDALVCGGGSTGVDLRCVQRMLKNNGVYLEDVPTGNLS